MKQIAIYAVVGLATLTTYTAVAVLLQGATQLIQGAISMIAYACAAATNFLGHRLFTFQSSRALGSALPRYGLLLGFNALVGGAFVQLGVSYLGLSAPMAHGMMLCGVTVSTFFLMKWWVMSNPRVP